MIGLYVVIRLWPIFRYLTHPSGVTNSNIDYDITHSLSSGFYGRYQLSS